MAFFMSRRSVEARAAANFALAENKERGDRALAAALEACAALGRATVEHINRRHDMGEPTAKQQEFIDELSALTGIGRLSLGEIRTVDDASNAIDYLLDRHDGDFPIRHETRQAVFVALRGVAYEKADLYAAVGITTLGATATQRDGRKCLRYIKGKNTDLVPLVATDFAGALAEVAAQEAEPVAPVAPARPVRIVPGRDMRPRAVPEPVVAPAPTAPVLPPRPVTPGRVTEKTQFKPLPIPDRFQSGRIRPLRQRPAIVYAGSYLETFPPVSEGPKA